jgi:hypothetical protein
LAYELPDGRLKLIDGHLRRDLDPDMLVDVEILDVNEDEARALLLSIDPLAALAQMQEATAEATLDTLAVALAAEKEFDKAVEVVDQPGGDDKVQTATATAGESPCLAVEHDRLLELAPPVPPDLQVVWEATAEANRMADLKTKQAEDAAIPEQFLILITCRDEQQQIEWLRRFQSEGMDCRALLS